MECWIFFMQPLSVFLFLWGMRNDYKFPICNLSLLYHFLKESPKGLKTPADGAGGLVYLFQQQPKLNAHKGKKQCESTLQGQGKL